MLVIVIQQIHGTFASSSSQDVWLERRFDLPFAPFSGLGLSDEGFECAIVEVEYDAAKQEFRCYIESEKEIYNAVLNHKPHRPIAELVAEYLENGWKHPTK